MSKIKILACTGVGGSGKTSVTKQLKETYGNRIAVAPSFTRKSYAKAAQIGIKVPDEKSALALGPYELAHLQVFLFSEYLKESKAFYRSASKDPRVEAVVFERAPFDHLAYIRSSCDSGNYIWAQLASDTTSWLKAMQPHILYFPSPLTAPWFSEEKFQDGFRKLDKGRMSVADIETVSMLRTFMPSKDVTYFEGKDKFDFLHRVRTASGILFHEEVQSNSTQF